MLQRSGVLSNVSAAGHSGAMGYDIPAAAAEIAQWQSGVISRRQLLDAGLSARTFDDACGWITRACGRWLTTEKKLRDALAVRKKMRWRTELGDVLAAAGDGIHSVLEYRYLRDVERAHGLPRSRHQVRVVIDGKAAYRDAYYEEYQLAVELDGQLAHPEEERWRDSHRDNTASAEGIQTIRYGWRDVYGHPCETALLQARILRRRGWSGTPRPCSKRCPVGREWLGREEAALVANATRASRDGRAAG